MKRNDAEPIGKLIQKYLRQESLESPLNEQRLLDSWELMMGRELLVRNLNQKVGATVITNIIFR